MRRWFAALLGPGRPPIVDRDGLERFLAGEAAFVAQKTMVEYCRARAGTNWDKLFAESVFRDALTIGRLRAYGAVLAAMVAVVARELAGSVSDGGPASRAALLALFDRLIDRDATQLPAAEIAALRLGLDARLVTPGAAPDLDSLATEAGHALFQALPLHRDLIRYDRELLVNGVRMGMIGFYDRLRVRIDARALTRDLAGAGAPVD